jgi:predicted Zn-dependent protease
MRTLGMFLFETKIKIFEDVLQDKPREIDINPADFLEKLGAEILRKFEGVFEKPEVVYVPTPGWDDISNEDFYIDFFPYRSGFTEDYLVKTLGKKNENCQYYRILGVYPGTIWFMTDSGLVPHINGTSESDIAIISLQTIFENDKYKLLNDSSNVASHELGHTFGLSHHGNCVMSQGSKKPLFCHKCLAKLHKIADSYRDV